ncbi:extracellular solute-binding protein [Gracilibacillus alcaliphilus]|uniref:extracellular solute-binding protein n=1 Tax=Gracilibacillus alcaliphilus TaxID=1401441 RepID=UPI00195648A1|nr:extracellular solute-binding protein [Gracilibacillus alcaliphilus]MBM7679011.1 putative aldouronate transport system substrate-binding protein [Gracilibacillus alcaliphilus]
MRKKLVILLVSIIGVIILAACQNDDSAGEAGSEESRENVNKEGFPIVEEPIELEFFTGKYEPNLDNYEETLVFETYAEQTGINVNFDEVPFSTLTEKRNLTLASGEYPDVFYSARIPSADIVSYSQQGVFIPLDDLIEEYAPNIQAFLEQHPDARKGLTMPDGHIYSIPSYYNPDFLPMLIGKPLWVNEKWLEELGMEEPTTIDEFTEYLQAVQETDLNGNGENDEIPFSAASIGEIRDMLKGAWGFGTRGVGNKFVDVDPETNELRFMPTEPKYQEMLEYIHDLYADGLIDPEIFTMDDVTLNAKGAQDILGANISPNPITVMNQQDFIGLGALEGPHGDQVYSQVKTPLIHVGAFAITSANEHPEATLRWIDYFFSEEGATFQFMGVEGETYEVTEDGGYEYVEEITNNPDGLTMDEALTPYVTWMGGSYPGYVQEQYFKGSESLPNAIEAGEKARPNVPEEIWNGFNYTEEELAFMQGPGGDLKTFVTEQEELFINGSRPFSEWDDFVDQINQMGLEEYMQIEAAAHERYQES